MDTGAARRAQHHGARQASARAVAQAPRMVEYLVEHGIGESGKLDFGDGLQTFRRHADARAGDQILGERRVDHTLGAELVEQAEGRAEHTAVAPDVLAQHHHIAVVGHRAVKREINGLDERYLRHVIFR
jgi:hypothetical protein